MCPFVMKRTKNLNWFDITYRMAYRKGHFIHKYVQQSKNVTTITSFVKCVQTDLSGSFLFLGVGQHVSFQIAKLRQFLPTFITFESFFPGVCEHVCFEATRLNKTFATYRTAVGFLAGVGSDVIGKMTR